MTADVSVGCMGVAFTRIKKQVAQLAADAGTAASTLELRGAEAIGDGDAGDSRI
jgi:hypothetical protein